jgi:Arc/MetJ family transcription regulator
MSRAVTCVYALPGRCVRDGASPPKPGCAAAPTRPAHTVERAKLQDTMNTLPNLRTPRRPAAQASFGRVSVGVQGRVMMAVAEGPFDAELMTATKRALALAGKRLPVDRRFADLLEIRSSLQMEADALAALRASIDSFTRRGIVAISTVFLVQRGIPGIERLPALMDIWRRSRPVRRADTFEAAWALVNADLIAAGLPPQEPPPRL